MADSDSPTESSRTMRKRSRSSGLEMFLPIGEGSSPYGLRPKITKKEKARPKTSTTMRKRPSRCRVMGKHLRRKADPPRKLELCDLPFLIIHRILQFIPVDDLENLAKTNNFFFNWICSELRTSADIPFKKEDINKMQAQSIIEKKPLLKLRCKDSTQLEDVVDDPLSLTLRDLPQFTMDLQMSLLDFSKLKELDLVPSTGMYSTKEQVRSHNLFGDMVLRAIRRNGTLSHIEKFDVLVDEFAETTVNLFGDKTVAFLEEMTKLRDFGLNILASTNLRKLPYNDSYLPMVEMAVSSSRASLLRLNVISETKRKVGKKILRSDHIQRIQFTGPCSFNGALLMPNLKIVEIDCGKYCYTRAESRTANIAVDPNNLHFVGKCGLMAASVYQNCPSVKEFAGVSLDGIDPKQEFSKWNSKVKRRFFKEYEKTNCFRQSTRYPKFNFPVMSCSRTPLVLEYKDWVKIYWFASRYPLVKKQ